jgi:hypothetical protein
MINVDSAIFVMVVCGLFCAAAGLVTGLVLGRRP